MEEEIKERHCTGCNTTKIITEFVKDKYDSTGYTYRCKVCRAKQCYKWSKENPEKVKQANLKNKLKRKEFYSSPEGIESSRRTHLKRVYGITLEEFNNKLKTQDYKCAICGGNNTHDKHKVFTVDHCHETGKIRDLLCYKCNSGLGLFNDNIELLSKAINYLQKHKNYEPIIVN